MNRSLKLKNALESYGWTNVTVHWERISSPLDGCGHGGGWIANIPDYDGHIEYLGYNYDEAMHKIQTAPWLNNDSKLK